jgi:hypothetical protein
MDDEMGEAFGVCRGEKKGIQNFGGVTSKETTCAI